MKVMRRSERLCWRWTGVVTAETSSWLGCMKNGITAGREQRRSLLREVWEEEVCLRSR